MVGNVIQLNKNNKPYIVHFSQIGHIKISTGCIYKNLAVTHLIVGLPLDPSTRVPAEDVFAHFVVDEDDQTERHCGEPPCKTG